jgi:hypothetical protein
LPDGVADIVRDEQGASSVDCNSDGSSHRFAFTRHEASQYIDGIARWTPTGKWHKDHLVAAMRKDQADESFQVLSRSVSRIEWIELALSPALHVAKFALCIRFRAVSFLYLQPGLQS